MHLPPEQESIRAKCFHPSGTFVEFPKTDVETSVPERFEKIVRAHPDHLAIKTPADELTYDALNRAANHVAHTLMDRQISEANPVALLFENGIEIIVAMLGVLKAGHFFILLDPALPKEKNVDVLARSQARLVFSDARNGRLAKELAGSGLQVVDYESVSRGALSTNCAAPVTPEMFTYVVYTSGSTGEPKGVIWSHQTLLHHVMALTNTYHICKDDKISLMASLSGGALATIAHALLNGATLYPYDVQRSGVAELADWLRREKISVCFMSSPLFRNMAAGIKANNPFNDLRLIRLRSEKVHESDIEVCKKILPPNCIVVTGLAMTETGTITMNLLDRGTPILGNEVPIGFPVEDKEIFLIDDDGKEVGFNEVGEIVARSKYLSPGYWNNPELTKSKFKRDPGDPVKRIYYTGDLGLMRPDGSLLHKGRKDFRIKIRGYGVDLLEVEKALLSHSGIREVVVATPVTPSGDLRLVAYFTSALKLTPTVSDLRLYLENKLADYMIPSAFVKLDKIPLTTNGKVDRGALPEPDNKRPALSGQYALPRNEIEKTLVQIWEGVLDVRPIGIRDKFFDLGGHSLLAVGLFAKIDNTFGKQFRPATLFEAPTIEQLANILMGSAGEASWSALVPIQRNGSKPPFFWVHGDSSGAFLPKYLAPDQPIFGLEHQSQDGKPARYKKVETIAAHYLHEIRMVQPKGPYFLGGYSFGGTIAFEIAQQLKHQREEVAFLTLLDSGFPGLRDFLAQRDADSAESRISGKPLGAMLYRHWQSFSALGRTAKMQYVTRSLLDRCRESTQGIRKVLRKTVCGVNIALGRPIPRSLRSDYILDIYNDFARRRYVPSRYDGDVFYVKSEQRPLDHMEKWRELIDGEMKIHKVSGSHEDIRHEPFVGLWAGALQARLAESQAASVKLKSE